MDDSAAHVPDSGRGGRAARRGHDADGGGGADRPSTGAAVKESVAVDENTEHTAGITENATPSGAGNDSATTAGTAAEGALNNGDLTGRAGSDGAVKDGDAPSLDGEAVTAVGLGPAMSCPPRWRRPTIGWEC